MKQNATSLWKILLVTVVAVVTSVPLRAESWSVFPTGTTNNLRAITMLSDKVGFMVGDAGTILRTTNSGTTWLQQRIGSGFNKILYGVVVVDTNSFGAAVGDGGAALQKDPTIGSFSNYPNGQDTLYGTCQRADTVPTFMSVGTNGFLGQHQWHTETYQLYDQYYNPYDTTVFYVNMKQIPTGVTAGLHAITFNAATGYIVGDSGAVLKSTNNGNIWTVKSVGANVHLRALSWFDAHKILAVGLNGAMWLSTNDGTTWNNVTPPGLTTNLHGVSFSDLHNGVIVGDNALILQTADGGLTWQRVGVNSFANLNAVYCLPTTVGSGWYAVGDGGTLVQTAYGGTPVTYTRDASTVDFGGVTVGTKKNMLINYTNTSATGYVTVNVVSPDPRIVLSPTQFIMEAGTSNKIKVTCTPVDTMPIAIALLETDDATWLTDTIHVTAQGRAAMVRYTADTVVFDTAWAGRSRSVDAINTGNLTMTASVVSVSDTNLTVMVDTLEQADKHMTVTITMKHTVKHEINAFAVVRTNDWKMPLDTIHIIAHAAPLAVHDGVMPATPVASIYPNPSAQGTNVTVAMDEVIPTVVRVYDVLGNVVLEETMAPAQGGFTLLNTHSLRAGRYFVEIVAPDGVREFGGFVRH